MKRFSFILTTLLVLLPIQGSAVTLSLDPSTQDISVGTATSVNLNISGLGDGVSPSLGAFLAEILFDASVLSFDSVAYGSLLGDPDPLSGETDILTTTGIGSVSLEEISFLFDFELDALQSDSFTLATLTFTGIAVGTSALSFGTVDLADAAFPSSTLFPDALETATIRVESAPPGTAPEPGIMLLMLSGLLGFSALKHKRKLFRQ